MNKYEKSLDRIKKRVEIGEKWTDEDIEHYKTIVEALEIASELCEVAEPVVKYMED